MRHRNANRKLSRSPSHRRAMLRNLVTSLLEHEEVRTTTAKAKEVRRLAERMITLGKRESLHARRQALGFIKDPAVVSRLFSELAPRFADRNGGYTRIIKLGFRDGDGAHVALIELIGSEYKPEKGEDKTAKKSRKEKADAKSTAAKSAAPEKAGKKGAAKKAGTKASTPKAAVEEKTRGPKKSGRKGATSKSEE